MTFDEYVDSWFLQFVIDHEDDKEWCKDLMEQMGYTPVSDYLDEDETEADFLKGLAENNDEIYDKLFGYDAKVKFVDDLPDTEGFLEEMFTEVAHNDWRIKNRDFLEAFINDMVEHCDGYSNPIGFFEDLQHGGCQSGMIGMFIYNSDCKQFYIDHIDDMESFKEDLDDEVGYLPNEQKLPHYTWICWLCYEETAIYIAQELWPGTF